MLSSCGHISMQTCVLISSFKNTSNTGLGPSLMTPFYSNPLSKGPVFKYSHILKPGGLELPHTNLKKGIILSITVSVLFIFLFAQLHRGSSTQLAR